MTHACQENILLDSGQAWPAENGLTTSAFTNLDHQIANNDNQSILLLTSNYFIKIIVDYEPFVYMF